MIQSKYATSYENQKIKRFEKARKRTPLANQTWQTYQTYLRNTTPYVEEKDTTLTTVSATKWSGLTLFTGGYVGVTEPLKVYGP